MARPMVAVARTWQQLFPLQDFVPGPLTGISAVLERADVLGELERCEREARFPEALMKALGDLGLAEIFVGWDGAPRATVCHLNTLSAVAAQASGSLAITLGITGLALLPAYLAATPAQLRHLEERLQGGAVVAMLLSEWDSGSNLLAIKTRATRVGAPGQPGTHYIVTGEKQLINMVGRSDLLMTLVRTSEATTTSGLGAAAGLSVLLIERDATVEALPRWLTSPAPAADVGGVRFVGSKVVEDQRMGDEGAGFGLVQKALSLSRGGISAFAAGTANRAVGLAFAHGRERVLYGAPIIKLDAIAHHLVQMAACNLAATCLSLKACAAVNALGLRAAHHTALAKLACCDLAERVVAEGRAVLGARALLMALPYQQLARDVTLYGIFDGTRHVMLDQIQRRLRQISCRSQDDEEPDDGDALYRATPASIVDVVRRGGRPWLPRPSQTAARLSSVTGALELGPLGAAARALEDVARRLDGTAWQTQSLSFALGECLAQLEAALAVAELADPPRRLALGARLAEDGDRSLPLTELAGYTIAFLAGRALADLGRVASGAGVDVELGGLLRELAMAEATRGTALRAALRDST